MNSISYCTTCSGRLWQLEQTLPHNVKYLSSDFELCILAYNDDTVKPFLEKNYLEYLADGRIKLFIVNSKDSYSCGRAKHIIHTKASKKILVNLDADNFITHYLHGIARKLSEKDIFKHHGSFGHGGLGRIGLHASQYKKLKGYRNVGRNDDADLIVQALNARLQLRLKNCCEIEPIPNIQE